MFIMDYENCVFLHVISNLLSLAEGRRFVDVAGEEQLMCHREEIAVLSASTTSITFPNVDSLYTTTNNFIAK